VNRLRNLCNLCCSPGCPKPDANSAPPLDRRERTQRTAFVLFGHLERVRRRTPPQSWRNG
jgi:hypothetical protein